MANEPTVMASVTSTHSSHGGPRAAMSVSLPTASDGEQAVGQGSIDAAAKAPKEPHAKATPSASHKDNDEIEKQAQELQRKLTSLSKLKGWAIHFSLVPELDQPVIEVIEVIDVETRQVIRQIPSEEILLLNKRFQAMVQARGDGPGLAGLLFDDQV